MKHETNATPAGLILRAFYLPVDLDCLLRSQAFAQNITRNELLKKILEEKLKPSSSSSDGRALVS